MAVNSVKTKSGLDVIIFFDKASETLPLLGMYFSEGEWYPHRWATNGSAGFPTISGLDLDMSPR